jgi:hypothetical protein
MLNFELDERHTNQNFDGKCVAVNVLGIFENGMNIV